MICEHCGTEHGGGIQALVACRDSLKAQLASMTKRTEDAERNAQSLEDSNAEDFRILREAMTAAGIEYAGPQDAYSIARHFTAGLAERDVELIEVRRGEEMAHTALKIAEGLQALAQQIITERDARVRELEAALLFVSQQGIAIPPSAQRVVNAALAADETDPSLSADACVRCNGMGTTDDDAITPWKSNPCSRCDGSGKEPGYQRGLAERDAELESSETTRLVQAQAAEAKLATAVEGLREIAGRALSYAGWAAECARSTLRALGDKETL